MHALIQTVAFRGIDTIPVNVQVHIANGLPAIAVVGLADKAVAESRERVRAALSSIGLALPPKRIAVNLAPADVLKEGAHFDLPIALGLLVAMGVVPQDAVADRVVLGELALDGSIQAVSGILPAAIAAAAVVQHLICPAACSGEFAQSSKRRADFNPAAGQIPVCHAALSGYERSQRSGYGATGTGNCRRWWS